MATLGKYQFPEIGLSESIELGKKIVREPAVEKLDPNWEKAHSQREKTLLWSVGKGGEIEGKKEGFEHVLSAEINER